jgi:hypothetical protein
MKIGKLLLIPLLLIFSVAQAQSQLRPLAEVEEELAGMAKEVLTHDSLEHKIKVNKKFARLLIQTLKRPESFTYPFEKMETVSVLEAEDQSFRLFTWHILDWDPEVYQGEQYYYYFGLVQRKYENEAGEVEYLVIPLLETQQVVPEMEHMVLDNQSWLGAQYYLPKYRKKIPSYTLKIQPPDTSNAYVIGKNDPDRFKKRKIDFYLLFGWNGYDHRTNYKVLDVMHFDPDDPERVLFGAEVFIYQKAIGKKWDSKEEEQKVQKVFISKHRALFKYSDNAPFSLNMAYVKKGFFGMGKKEMIVFDHLAEGTSPGGASRAGWEIGPDGSYDALAFTSRGGGYFQWYSNVELAEKYNRKLSREQREVYETYHPDSKMSPKMTQKYLEEYSEAERERLKKAGIDLDKEKKKKKKKKP